MDGSMKKVARGQTIVTPGPAPSHGEPTISKNPSAKDTARGSGMDLSHSIKGATVAGAAGQRAGRPGAKS